MSYVSSHFHIVYSTKERVPTIPEKLQPKLWAYMAGIAAIGWRAPSRQMLVILELKSGLMRNCGAA
jgi:hypothetical protein